MLHSGSEKALLMGLITGCFCSEHMLRSDGFIRFALGGGDTLSCTTERKENTEGFIVIQQKTPRYNLYCSLPN